jgi:hypothetical protein
MREATSAENRSNQNAHILQADVTGGAILSVSPGSYHRFDR